MSKTVGDKITELLQIRQMSRAELARLICINNQLDKQEIINIVNSMGKLANAPTKKQKRKAL